MTRQLISAICICFLLAATFPVWGQNAPKSKFQNPFSLYNQNPMTVTYSNGVMGYWGDLADFGLETRFLRPAVSAAWNYYLRPRISTRVELTVGTIYSNDVISRYDTHRARNLHFRSRIYEASISAVYEIFKNPNLSTSYYYKMGTFCSPYFHIGASVFHFNPKAELNGTWVDLQPLGTEGQYIQSTNQSGEVLESKYPEPYKLWQISVPFGFGIKFFCSKLLTLGVETNIRKTFTDYLDDVSTVYPDFTELAQTPNGRRAVTMSDRVDSSIRDDVQGVGAPRGNPKYKDYYHTLMIRATYFINWKSTSK